MGNPQSSDPNGIMRGNCGRLAGGDRQKGIRVYSQGQAPKTEGRVSDCARLEGGNKKPSVAGFVLAVTNPSEDNIWRDDDQRLVQEETGDYILLVNV
jgi:hypothetical protein